MECLVQENKKKVSPRTFHLREEDFSPARAREHVRTEEEKFLNESGHKFFGLAALRQSYLLVLSLMLFSLFLTSNCLFSPGFS